MRIPSLLSVALPLAGFLLAGEGCVASYDHTEIDPITQGAQLQGVVSAEQIQVPIAGVVEAKIMPFNTDNNPLVPGVYVEDPGTLKVIPGVTDRSFAFLGVKTGNTRVHLQADGRDVMVVQASVVAQ